MKTLPPLHLLSSASGNGRSHCLQLFTPENSQGVSWNTEMWWAGCPASDHPSDEDGPQLSSSKLRHVPKAAWRSETLEWHF